MKRLAFSVVTATLITLALWSLSGCSAKARIADAAQKAHGHASSAVNAIDKAKATGDVGPKAQPYIEESRDEMSEVITLAGDIQDELPGVKDVQSPFWRWVNIAIVTVLVLGLLGLAIYLSPFLRPLLIVIGTALKLIPKPDPLRAKVAADFIADPAPIDKTDIDQIRLIEREKLASPVFKQQLDAELTAKGIPT